MSVTVIDLPISSNYLTTFMINYIQLKYFNETTITLESLKSLVFPADYKDESFRDFIRFIDTVLNLSINEAYDTERIVDVLQNSFTFKKEILTTILEALNKKRFDITSKLNQLYNGPNTTELHSVNWEVKTVLSGDTDNNYSSRYCDIEFLIQSPEELSKAKKKQINITFLKEDILRLNQELNNIKNNIIRVKASATHGQ